MLPIILTNNARKRIEEIGNATMTFRAWGVNPPGHLAVEVFFTYLKGSNKTENAFIKVQFFTTFD